jgi:ATP-dependent RNA helicase RhlE
MLDLGFEFQLNNIFDHCLQSVRTYVSATMTDDIEEFILAYFFNPLKVVSLCIWNAA